MFDKKAFKERMKKVGVSIGVAAAKLGVDPATLYRKMSGESDFTRKEIVILREFLCLTMEDVDAIFFAQKSA